MRTDFLFPPWIAIQENREERQKIVFDIIHLQFQMMLIQGFYDVNEDDLKEVAQQFVNLMFNSPDLDDLKAHEKVFGVVTQLGPILKYAHQFVKKENEDGSDKPFQPSK